MRIKEILGQHRRDFQAVYECEHCGNEQQSYGYDDFNFHQNVIPKMKCKSCKLTAKDDYEPRETKYPEGFQV